MGRVRQMVRRRGKWLTQRPCSFCYILPKRRAQKDGEVWEGGRKKERGRGRERGKGYKEEKKRGGRKTRLL